MNDTRLKELQAQLTAADEEYTRLLSDPAVDDGTLEAARVVANALHQQVRLEEASARGFAGVGNGIVRYNEPGRP